MIRKILCTRINKLGEGGEGVTLKIRDLIGYGTMIVLQRKRSLLQFIIYFWIILSEQIQESLFLLKEQQN